MKATNFYMNDWLKVLQRNRSTREDTWYLQLAHQLLNVLNNDSWLTTHTYQKTSLTALQLTAYLHDVIAQTGGWKMFTAQCQKMYQRPIPFYACNDQYLADEINLEDVAYLLWASCNQPEQDNILSPLQEELLSLGQRVYECLDQNFEEAPISELPSGPHWIPGMQALMTESTPLPEITATSKLTHDVEKCLAYSQEHPLIFIPTYEQLQDFLIQILGWKPQPEGILSDLKEEKDFVIYANARGMLIAPHIASCLKEEQNPLYNAQAASEWGYELFTTPGACPFDLLKYSMKHGLLPDAQLPFENGKELLHQNWDFIARYFLKDYYEGD